MDSKKLDNTIEELEQSSKALKAFVDVYSELSELKKEFSLILNKFEENNASFDQLKLKIKRDIDTNTLLVKGIKENLEGGLITIEKDLKSFQKDLENTTNSKLTKHKSDIEVTIRNEGLQTQRGFENALKSEFNSLNKELMQKFVHQEQEINQLKNISIITILICVVLGVMLFFK